MSDFDMAILLSALFLFGSGILSFLVRFFGTGRRNKSVWHLFRQSFELRTVFFLMLIPMFYLGYHKVSYSWGVWLILAALYYVIFYAFVKNARKRLRVANGGDAEES
jgi:hypothetical protein